jgi:hypothetical protein
VGADERLHFVFCQGLSNDIRQEKKGILVDIRSNSTEIDYQRAYEVVCGKLYLIIRDTFHRGRVLWADGRGAHPGRIFIADHVRSIMGEEEEKHRALAGGVSS